MKKPSNLHPGEVLLEQFLRPRNISHNALAGAAGLPPHRVNEIVLGRRGISADTASRLAAALDTTERFWLDLQARYDLLEESRGASDADAWTLGCNAA